MKKNFLITADIVDMWEFYENNFLLGKWCEFYLFDKEKINEKLPKEVNIVKNQYHWSDYEKRNKDYIYLQKVVEYFLETVSEKFSKIHNINENIEYWRIILNNWLSEYVVTNFDRWENIRIFFEKNKNEKFYSNYFLLDENNYIPKNHVNFNEIVQTDEWNHLFYLRLFNFLNIKNLTLVRKKINNKYLDTKKSNKIKDIPLGIRTIQLIDSMIAKFAFKYNKIIFESFIFPNKEYLKICLLNKLIPSKYTNLFNFDINENDMKKDNTRYLLKNSLLNINNKDSFIKFLLLNIHKDMPKSYLENFNSIRKKILPFSKNKKTIFSMHSIDVNDNFKIYLAETKKVGSKFTHVQHGGGLELKMHVFFNVFEKISNKMIIWGNSLSNENYKIKLSPSLPIIKLEKLKPGNHCSILFVECLKYLRRFNIAPSLEHKIDFFNDLIQFVNELNPEIKSKIKFRVKKNWGFNAERKFSEKFGPEYIDKASYKNPLKKTILNSKLIITTYPETSFSEAMHYNIPTILIIKSKQWALTEDSLDILDDLKKNKIAFENFNEAKNHINRYWHELDSWWKLENVQRSRKLFLKNFFDVKSDWFKQWSDYIYSIRQT